MTNQTFEQLKKTYESGRTRPLAWRRAQLNALRRLVTENRDAFVSSAMADLGKPAAETVLMELNLVAGEAQFRLPDGQLPSPKAWCSSFHRGIIRCCWPWNQWLMRSLPVTPSA